jgi:AcrR family transcriptional regulator
MPKVVDRVEQRREIGAALLRVVAREGMEEVSVRAVAAEAGRSAGAVQKYFRTKDEMLGFALELAGERTNERFAAVDPTGPVEDVLRRYIVATLPLDEERRSEAQVWIAFTAKAMRHDEYAEVLRQIDREVREVLVELLAEVPGDPELLADGVIALADGFASRMLYTRDQDDELLAALDAALSALLEPPQR